MDELYYPHEIKFQYHIILKFSSIYNLLLKSRANKGFPKYNSKLSQGKGVSKSQNFKDSTK